MARLYIIFRLVRNQAKRLLRIGVMHIVPLGERRVPTLGVN